MTERMEIIAGINGEVEIIEANPELIENIKYVNKLVYKVIENVDNELIRDEILVNIMFNYEKIYERYFKWLEKYIDFSRVDNDSLTTVLLYSDILSDNLNKKEITILKNDKFMEKYEDFVNVIIEIHNNRNDYQKYTKILYDNASEYKDIIELYYPEFIKFINYENLAKKTF